ncbi:ANKRD17, partial [Symbiodinium pilosum]
HALRWQHGFPLCQQQLLHNGMSLADATPLDGPMGIQLVLMSLTTVELRLAASQELEDVCKDGHIEVARLLLEAGTDDDGEHGARDAGLRHAALMGN